MNHLRTISDSFSELAVNNCLNNVDMHIRGNVIKASASERPVHEPEVNEQKPADTSEPEIIVHREGEEITRIEFVCSCGKRGEIQFDYAKE